MLVEARLIRPRPERCGWLDRGRPSSVRTVCDHDKVPTRCLAQENRGVLRHSRVPSPLSPESPEFVSCLFGWEPGDGACTSSSSGTQSRLPRATRRPLEALISSPAVFLCVPSVDPSGSHAVACCCWSLSSPGSMSLERPSSEN